MNIKNILYKSIFELRKSGIPTPELDVKVLLSHAIEKDNAFTYSHPEYLITNSQYSKFRRYIRRRKKGEPIAYLVGHKEFYGYDFLVNKNVLIPRPETEYLVEKGIEFIKDKKHLGCHPELACLPVGMVSGSHNNEKMLKPVRQAQGVSEIESQVRDDKINILDIGTGSGCIIISIAKLLETSNLQLETKLYASDISKKALFIAKKNAEKLEVKNLIHFYNSDLFENIRMPKEYDLILANLPYVPQHIRSQITDNKIRQKKDIDFEPQNAIFAAKKGSFILEKFLFGSKDKLRKQGRILLELDPRNATILFSIAKKNYPDCKVEIEKDLSGKNRYLIIQN